MTLLQIAAFISVLISFGVDAQTVAQIQAILTPPVVVAPAPVLGALPVIPPVMPKPVEAKPVVPVAPTPAPIPASVIPTPAPVVEAPKDTTAPIIGLFSIDTIGDGKYLRVVANEPLNFSKTVLPEGVTMEIVKDNPKDGTDSRFGGHVAHSYKAKLTGVDEVKRQAVHFGVLMGFLVVTIQDMAGNTVTRELAVN